MEVEFYGSPTNSIKGRIETLIKESDKVSIAVAFLKDSGVNSILQALKERGNIPKVCIITGLYFGITDAEALRNLLKINVRCRIADDYNFHPKLYIFEKGDGNTTISVGSSNLSEGGLLTNSEANIIVQGKISESPIKEAVNYFSNLLDKSTPLNEKIIEDYAQIKKETEEDTEKINTTVQKNIKKLYKKLPPKNPIIIDPEVKEVIIKFKITRDNLRGKYLQILEEFLQYFPPVGSHFKIIDYNGYTHNVHLEGQHRITGLQKRTDPNNHKFFNEGLFEEGDLLYMEVIKPKEIYRIINPLDYDNKLKGNKTETDSN